MINEATKFNLRRKSAFVDHVQIVNGAPLFSWVDLSLTELCNRTCSFCPRSNPASYPNQKLHMPLKLAGKIAGELFELNYEGAVVLCGYGEPTLYPELETLISLFGNIRVELVTDGDFLTVEKIQALYKAGLNYVVISLYDGPHQAEPMGQRFLDAGINQERYLIRDRWHTEADDFGLKLTNRAGAVSVGNQDAVDKTRPCHYLTYQMQIDWNGDVLLCPQDWGKKVKYGNLNNQSMIEVWTSQAMHAKRRRLIAGRRTDAPCSSCNTDGTLHGFNHVTAWENWKR